MSMLIELAIYAALAAGAMLAFHEFEQEHYVKPALVQGAAEQRAKDQPILDQVKAERDAALTNAATSKSNFEGCSAQLDAASAATGKIAKDSAARIAAAHTAAMAAAANDAQQRALIDKLKLAAAASPIAGQSCVDLLNKVDAIERAGARERRAK